MKTLMQPWYRIDQAEAARVAASLRRFDARRELEAMHADVSLRFVPPVNSDVARWEAIWDSGRVEADTDTDVYALVRERLGAEA